MNNIRILLIILLLINAFTSLYLQVNAQVIVWEKNYGGSADEIPNSIISTEDGGYIIIGETHSTDKDITISYGESDVWVIKINDVGDIEWQKNYGGSNDDIGYSIISSDEGYIFVASTSSDDNHVEENIGGTDIWVVAINVNGDIKWENTYGGTNSDVGRTIIQTSDGGYLIGAESFSIDMINDFLGKNIMLIKIDSFGNMEWSNTYGGNQNDSFLIGSNIIESLQGYVAVGFTSSDDENVTNNNGASDLWIFKTNYLGDLQWQKNYGGSASEQGGQIIETSDGEYIISAQTTSSDMGVDYYGGGNDNLLIKLNSNGDLLWQENYGGTGNENTPSLQLISDGSYTVVSNTTSSNIDVSNNNGESDIWMYNIDDSRLIKWGKNFGGTEREDNPSIVYSLDGTYIVSCFSASSDIDVSDNYGGWDIWIFKVQPPLGGTYTVGHSPNSDFSSLTHAMDSLSLVGLYKAVTLEIEAGITLNEQVCISPIPSITATKNVTINGNGANLTYAPSSEQPAIIQIDEVDHININNLNIIAAPNAECAWGIHLKNQADSIYIHNCLIDVNVNATDTCFIGIVASNDDTSINTPEHWGNNANRMIINHNTILGGFMGIAILGNEAKSMKGPVIQSNVIQDSYQAGVFVSYLNNFLLKWNEVDLGTGARDSSNENPDNSCFLVSQTTGKIDTFTYCIYTENQLEEYDYSISGIEGNDLHGMSGQGIQIGNYEMLADTSAYMVNNTISGDFQIDNPQNAGILLKDAHDWWIYHNSVNVQNHGYALYIDAASLGIDVQNNTLTYTSNTTTGFVALIEDVGSLLVWDYNNYFSQNPNIILQAGGTNYNDIVLLPDNENSVSVNPIFFAFHDLHIVDLSQQTNAANPVIALLFPLDIDREPRPDGITQLPDMGADEMIPLVVIDTSLCANIGKTIEYTIPDSLHNPQWIEVIDSNILELIAYESTVSIEVAAEAPAYIGIGSNDSSIYAFILSIDGSDAFASNNSPICEGEDVELSGMTTGNGEQISYHWSGPNGFVSTEQNPIITEAEVLGSGDYLLEVDVDGCFSEADTTKVLVMENPSISVEVSGTACVGENIQLIGSTATIASSIAYQWSGPNGFSSTLQNPVLSEVNLSNGGTYNLIISIKGCVSEPAMIEAVVYPIPDVLADTNSPICLDGEIMLLGSTTSTAENMVYQWTGPNSFSSTKQNPVLSNATEIQAGEYSLVVSANGCDSEVATTNVFVEIPPMATLIDTAFVCNTSEDGSILDFTGLVVDGDIGGMWIDVEGTGVNLNNLTMIDFESVPENSYQFNYTTNSAIAPCEEQTYSTVIAVQDCTCPSVAIVKPNDLCNDSGMLDLTTLELGIDVGTWSIGSMPAGSNPPTLISSVFDATDAGVGDYEIVFTLTTPKPNCPEDSMQILTVQSAVNAGMGSSMSFCNDNDTLINLFSLLSNADSGGVWELHNGVMDGGIFDVTNATFAANGQNSGDLEFRYIVTAIAPCENDTAFVAVEVITPPSATLYTSGTICNSNISPSDYVLDLTSLVTGGDMEGIWIDVDGTGVDLSTYSSVDFDGVPPNTYQFEYTTNSATPPCNEQTYTIDIIVEDCECPNVATASPADLCNDSGILDLTTLELGMEAGTWSITSEPIGETPATLGETVFDAIGADIGEYEITFTLDNPQGTCPDVSTQTLMVQSAVSAGIGGSETVCNGTSTSIDLFSLLTNADIGGDWSLHSGVLDEGIFDVDDAIFTVAGQSAGVLEFSYTVSAIAPCVEEVSIISINVLETPLPPMPITDFISICDTEINTIAFEIGGVEEGTTVHWYDAPIEGNLLSSGLTFSPTVAGTYYAQTVNSCQSELIPFELVINTTPTALFDATTTTCTNSLVLLSFTGSADEDAIFVWDMGTGDVLNGIGEHNYSWSNVGEYEIVLTVEQNGCIGSYTTTIDVSEVEVVVESSDNEVETGDNITLTATGLSYLEGDLAYYWTSTGNLPDCTDCPQTNAIVNQNTVFIVEVEDEYGCIAIDSVEVTLISDIVVPLAFSPNGDGVNDFFKLTPINIDYLEVFEIYNRWGKKVFSTNQLSEAWDGEFKSVAQKNGAYVYVIRVITTDGNVFMKTGNITLIR